MNESYEQKVELLIKNQNAILETMQQYGTIFDELRLRLTSVEQRITQLEQQLTNIRQMAARSVGTGSTAS